MKCQSCGDCGWVCENHDDRPWEAADSDMACDCGGAGMPCPVCNMADADKMPRPLTGSTEIWNIYKGWLN